eukprot:GEMP01003542.1.p1 GENE.GEMP01003542.1~~GEMP01003542.1.p1  ORF type:complete len:493 (+),score=57.14 GEMP01003542.1:258-1736(+)
MTQGCCFSKSKRKHEDDESPDQTEVLDSKRSISGDDPTVAPVEPSTEDRPDSFECDRARSAGHSVGTYLSVPPSCDSAQAPCSTASPKLRPIPIAARATCSSEGPKSPKSPIFSRISSITSFFSSASRSRGRSQTDPVDGVTATPGTGRKQFSRMFPSFRSMRTPRASKLSQSQTLIARKFTENLDLIVEPMDSLDIIHGLTDENKKMYKEALLRLSETPEWQCAYESINPPARLLYQMDHGNKAGWLYLAMILPVPLVDLLAPTLEVETWTKWHPYCTKHVKTGSHSTWQFQSHFEQSMAWGAFKTDQNTRTLRWVNESQGFFLQSLHTLSAGDDGYIQPRLNRDNLQADVLSASPSPNESLMLQRIRIEMPVALPHFVQKFVFGTVAPKLLKQMTANAANVPNPKFPYKALVEEDIIGIYEYLKVIMQEDAAKPTNIIECTLAFLRGEPTHGPSLERANSGNSKKGKTNKKTKQQKSGEAASVLRTPTAV